MAEQDGGPEGEMGLCTGARVLAADLRWVEAAGLGEGDALVAVDEHVPGGRGAARKMRLGVVVRRRERRANAYRLTFEDERVVLCSGRQPWLSRPPGDARSALMRWRSIESSTKKRIKRGSQVRWITRPWGEPTAEDGWFAGMLDGEGYISKANVSAGIGVCQRPGPVWDRLIAYAAARGYNPKIEGDATFRPSKFGRTPVPKLAFGRLDEMMRLVGQGRPTRFIEDRFWADRDLPGKKSGVGWTRIESVEPVGERLVVDLEVDVGGFVAEGCVALGVREPGLITQGPALTELESEREA